MTTDGTEQFTVFYGDYVAHWYTEEAAVLDARYESAKNGVAVTITFRGEVIAHIKED